jgi:hypothetical protein
VEGVGDRQVCRQRHPGVAILALEPSVEAQLPSVVAQLQHLFRERDSRSPPNFLGGDDAPRQLGEGSRQRVIVDVLVDQLRPAADHRSFDAIEP